MHRTPMLLVALFAFAFGGSAASTAIAQEAAPAGEAVDPAQCQVAPRPAEFFQNLGTPTAGQGDAAVASSPAPEGLPAGPAADQAAVDAVAATYRELVACVNAGDFLRLYALYTDDYVRRTVAEQGGEAAALLATPSPADEGQRTRFVGVREVRDLGGGTLAAIVEIADPAFDGTSVYEAILVRPGDRYLIDQETVIEAPAAAGTPAAAAATDQAPAAEADQYEVVSYDIYFEPTTLTIPADTDVVVSLPNQGVALHNFAIEQLGIDVDISPGATEQVTINAPAGEYEYVCNVPGHKAAGMVGVLTVE